MIAGGFLYVLVPHMVRAPRPSQFQAFSTSSLCAEDLLVAVSYHPAHILELRQGLRANALHRCRGYARYSVRVVHPDWLLGLPAPGAMVLVTARETDDLGREFARRHPHILHLPTVPQEGESGAHERTLKPFEEWLPRMDEHSRLLEPQETPFVPQLLAMPNDAGSERAIRIFNDPLTRPNDMTMASLRFALVDAALETTGLSPADRLRLSYESVATLRSEIYPAGDYPPGGTTLSIVSTAIYRKLPAVAPSRFARDYGDSTATAYRGIVAGQGKFTARGLELDSDEARSLASERQAEIDTQLAMIGLLNAAQVTPTIVVSDGFEAARPAVDTFARLLSSPRQNTAIVSSAIEAGEALSKCLPSYVRDALRDSAGTVSVFSDDPVELADVGGRPMFLSRPVVRVPVTPGEILGRQLNHQGAVFLHPRDFSRVIVLRGTLRDDPIHGDLERFCRALTKEAPGVSLEVHDFASIGDIDRALSQFDGAVMILDTHGVHGPRTGGRVQAQRQQVSLFEGELRSIPPIVILSACDTQPIGRAQDSIANALLMQGARAVVGTIAPVDALHSALFVGSVFARLQSLRGWPGPLRWSEYFAHRMWEHHVLDATLALTAVGVLSASPSDAVAMMRFASDRISEFSGGWFEPVLREMSRRFGVPTVELAAAWRRHAYLTQSCLYCQLGSADSVLLTPSDEWGQPAVAGAL